MRHVVIGGGVAGVSCAEELCRLVPHDTVTLVAADKVLKGVGTVARITRNIEELKVEEKQLDALPYPNLTMVQDVATGIDTDRKELLLASHSPLPYDKLCICAGARPKQLAAGITSPHIITLRDTQSLQALCAQLEGGRRVMVVGNGAIALEAVFALRGMEVVWVMKHGHIGDAVFDIDAAQFLLEEMQQAEQGAQHAQQQQQQQQQEAGPGRPRDSGTPGDSGGGRAAAQQGQQRRGAPTVRQGKPMQQGQHAQHPGTLGHAVGPTWVAALPHAEGETRVVLEYGCSIKEITPCARCSTQGQQQESSRQRVSLSGGAAVPGSSWREFGMAALAVPSSQPVEAGGGSALGISSGTATGGPPGPEQASASGNIPAAPLQAAAAAAAALGDDGPWNLLVRLTSGKQYGVDLVISAIGVTPALDWVPPEVKRAKDGGLSVDRCMETSLAGVYAAGDSCSAQWAAEDSPHWFQMRLWTQARTMGIYAAHCMAGVQDQTGVAMAFELFTHATRFMGHKVVLLGLYNGQRLEAESPEDVVTYSRVTDGPGRTFVRVLLLRGRVQGAVLIGETDLEETMENLILDQLDVGGYGPGLLDPDVELDHVFD